MTEPPSLIRQLNEARVIRAFGDEMILHLGADDTGGRFSMWTNVTPPGGGPPPHYHEHEDEWFWPLSGPAEFLKDGEWIEVPERGAVFMPRGTIHTFRNPNLEPLEMLIQTVPGGFDRFFAECGDAFSRGGEPDMGEIVAISARYGIHYPAL
ncbi:MAG: cupin domain-containing protein [Verrucomicrobiales bacterium]|nr:cupin domain-containing protein [Verrucomicrobiales bacterium]